MSEYNKKNKFLNYIYDFENTFKSRYNNKETHCWVSHIENMRKSHNLHKIYMVLLSLSIDFEMNSRIIYDIVLNPTIITSYKGHIEDQS